MSDMNEMERWYAYGDENGDIPDNDWYPDDEDDEVGICQNCDAQLTLEQARRGTLYCSEKCSQTASAVRYGRATLRDGRYERDPQVRDALEQKIAHSLGGGYPEKARKLSPEQREAIFTRDNRRCRLCGAPATEIDHIAGSSSDPKNLQALCKPCNMAKAAANFRSATPEEAAEGNAIWARIRATRPVRLCDNEKQWDELRKEIAAEQRKRARETGNH
jgi:5-methylcytosine-specific restriction endonuclease McrA